MPKRFQSHERKHRIAERDGWLCNFCQRPTECATCNPAARIIATLDHVVPRSKGGPDAFTNLCIACARCNLAKGDGVWPDLTERPLIPDRGGRNRPRKWQQKRDQEPAVQECYYRRTGRRPSKTYATKEAAAQAIASVLERTGKQLATALCRHCHSWHVFAPVVKTASGDNEPALDTLPESTTQPVPPC